MKIIEATTVFDDYRQGYKIICFGDAKPHVMSFVDGEPEDANLSRDFGDVFQIPSMLAVAHAADEVEFLDLGEIDSDRFSTLESEEF